MWFWVYITGWICEFVVFDACCLCRTSHSAVSKTSVFRSAAARQTCVTLTRQCETDCCVSVDYYRVSSTDCFAFAFSEYLLVIHVCTMTYNFRDLPNWESVWLSNVPQCVQWMQRVHRLAYLELSFADRCTCLIYLSNSSYKILLAH